MRIEFSNIIDSHKGKKALCVATGPSLRPYLSSINNLSKSNKEEYCFLSMNDFDKIFEMSADYRVVANSVLSIENEHQRYNQGPLLIYADSVDLTPVKRVEELLEIDYISYDQRHFNGEACFTTAECCDQITSGRLTIQEELQKYTGHEEMYSSGSTGALHMAAISIILGCKEIYIFGVDLDYEKGYATEKKDRNWDDFSPYVDSIVDDFRIIAESAEKIGAKIYSTCKGSPINKVIQYKRFHHGDNKKISSVILARGGSKGIPRKNVKQVKGAPLISYSIKASLASLSDETWVCTDDHEIAEESSKFGANILIRPPHLATDTSKSEEALLFFAEKINTDIIVFIQPTSPLIHHEYIDAGIKMVLSGTYDSVFSAFQEHWLPRWTFDEFALPDGWEMEDRPRRQDMPTSWVENGAFYITSRKNLIDSKLRYSGRIGIVEMPISRSFQVDSTDDLHIVERML
jgi:CMP-N,N'-diacetyllegionaminic acid synthase